MSTFTYMTKKVNFIAPKNVKKIKKPKESKLQLFLRQIDKVMFNV